MLSAELLEEIMNVLPGHIPHCQRLVDQGKCHWDCCVYTDSYCLLLPGEHEAALSLGFRFHGYDFLDTDYYGGKKIVPHSKGCCANPALGHAAYKSLDCKMYPLWPQLESSQPVLIYGTLCPIMKSGLSLEKHEKGVAEAARLLLQDQDVRMFLSSARMVGYQPYSQLEEGFGGCHQ